MDIKTLEKGKSLQKEIKWLNKVADKIYCDGGVSKEEFDIRDEIYNNLYELTKIKQMELEKL